MNRSPTLQTLQVGSLLSTLMSEVLYRVLLQQKHHLTHYTQQLRDASGRCSLHYAQTSTHSNTITTCLGMILIFSLPFSNKILPKVLRKKVPALGARHDTCDASELLQSAGGLWGPSVSFYATTNCFEFWQHQLISIKSSMDTVVQLLQFVYKFTGEQEWTTSSVQWQQARPFGDPTCRVATFFTVVFIWGQY